MSLSACLADHMVVTKGSLHQGRLVVWGNQFMARQGKFVTDMSCLMTIQQGKMVIHDYWARKGTKGEGEEGLLMDCDTPSSLMIR